MTVRCIYQDKNNKNYGSYVSDIDTQEKNHKAIGNAPSPYQIDKPTFT